MIILIVLAVITSSGFVFSEERTIRPNIVIIIADDLGWDDVSFHGSDQVQTPNIDLLAYSGIALQRYYTHAMCTPSRSALLTGKYSHTLGMQGYPLTNSEDRGLPTTEMILPQYLKELGYATHLVGKWHVGRSRTEFLPTQRGFDSHFGHRGGYIDYYEYLLEETWNIGPVTGFDLFNNLNASWESEGYITDIYTEHAKSIIETHDASIPLFLTLAHNAPHSGNDAALLQAPSDVIRSMRHIQSSSRRIYAAMVKKLDDSVGDVVEALHNKGILNNTIIAFMSDNGGMTSGVSINYASNWPLRGIKMSPFEGGVRVVGLIWSSNMSSDHHLWKGYMHVADWLPTLLTAVGATAPIDIDGIDHWDNIIENKKSDREHLFEIDDYAGYASITFGEYKLITGNVTLKYSDYQGDNLRDISSTPSYTQAIEECKVYDILAKIGKPFISDPRVVRNKMKLNCLIDKQESDICYPQNKTICMYNIIEDPCEKHDISQNHALLVEQMKHRLQTEMERVVPRIVPLYRDPRSHPNLLNYAWNVWADSLQ